MTSSARHSTLVSRRGLRVSTFALALVCAATMIAMQSAQAQTFSVLHDFTGGGDGAIPYAGLTLDTAGNLYGTTSIGGYTGGYCVYYGGCGIVFRLKASGQGWTLSPLYPFHMNDGAYPAARVIFGPNGTLYGTTSQGAQGGGRYGTVFNLRPSATVCKTALCPWTESLVWEFMGSPDGATPYSELTFNAGHFYGTTSLDGSYLKGTVYDVAQLPGGGWSENIDYSFGYSPREGAIPNAGVIFDNVGNMYTTTVEGGPDGCGTVAQLVNSASGWTETDLYTFTCESDGSGPYGGLIFDHAGNLYGTTAYAGAGGGGTVFELTHSSGSWTFQVLYGFAGQGGPYASLTMDAVGNLYGTTIGDGAYGRGSVFKLIPSNGGWRYSSLHDFVGSSDGEDPISNVTFDASGNLYGTAQFGGTYGEGVVWEITP